MNILGNFFVAFGEFADAIAIFTKGFGPLGILVFMLLYLGVILTFLPITPFSLAAGAIYGWWGIPIAYCSAVFGSLVAFLIARGAGRDYVKRLVQRRPMAAAIERCVVAGGWRLVLLIRLSGMLPFAVQNYSFGLTPLRIRDYLSASAIGLVPGAVVKVWIGKSGMDVLATGGEVNGPMGLVDKVQMISLFAAIIITLIMLAYVGRLAVKELKAAGVIETDEQ